MRPILCVLLIFLLLWCPGCQGFFLPDWFINWFGYSRPRPVTTVPPTQVRIPDLQGRNPEPVEENSTSTIKDDHVEVYTNSGGIFSRPNDELEPKKSWRPSRPLNIFEPSFDPFNTQNRYTPVLMPFKHSFIPGLLGGYPFGKLKPWCYLDYNHQHHRHGGSQVDGSNATNIRVDEGQLPPPVPGPFSVPAAVDPVPFETTTRKAAIDPVAYSASVESESVKEAEDVNTSTDPIWEMIQEVMQPATNPPRSYLPPEEDLHEGHETRPTKLSDLHPPQSATVIRVEKGQNRGEAMVLSAMLLNSQPNQYSAPDVQAYLPIKSQPYVEPSTTSKQPPPPRSITSENVTNDHPIYSVPLSVNHTVLGTSRGFRPMNQYPPFQRVWKPAIYPIATQPTSPYPIKLPPFSASVASSNEENETISGIRFESGFRPMRMMRRKLTNVNTFAIKL